MNTMPLAVCRTAALVALSKSRRPVLDVDSLEGGPVLDTATHRTTVTLRTCATRLR
jgi:hypothetical protein